MGIADRIDGYRRRLLHEWSMWRHVRRSKQKSQHFDAWLRQLASDPPDVLLGANFAEYGGVRGHLHAIQKYSSLNIGLAPPEDLILNGLNPHDFNTTFRQPFFEFPADQIRVAHSHVFPWFVQWCRSQQQHGIRWIHTYHNMYFPEFAVGELEPWQQEVNEVILTDAPHADVRISVSRWQQKYLRDEHGIETDYIPNGVDVGLCDRADGDRFKRAQQLDDYVLYVGRNDPVKNPADFVSLATRLPRQRFVMIGGGLTCEALTKDWNVRVPANLTVLGALPHSDVLDAIAGCSVVVITSLREGMPTLALEGMTLCKPIVVSDDAGCVEAIGGGEFGHIYECGMLDNLVEQTLSALDGNINVENSRKRVLDEFDWRVVAQQLDRVYHN